jgi:long-subunit acyl-CoA synthetase (AMP-forming)/pyrroloquinoline quinone (PQQ) biosynthesis protein C
MRSLIAALTRNAGQAAASGAISDGRQQLDWPQLAGRVAAASAAMGDPGETIGLAGGNGVDWAIGFLAASIAGKSIVPLPAFFSAEQLGHLVRDAGIRRIVATGDSTADLAGFGLPVEPLAAGRGDIAALPARDAGGLVIYTSGSTGAPKGVRLAGGQALWTAEALAAATGASAADRYLSVLPLSMLLEAICGVIIPTLVGGTVHYEEKIAAGLATGQVGDLAGAFEREQPTMSVLVPQLLGAYVQQLVAADNRPPRSLRFIAVGGAPVPAKLAVAASRLGLPYFEGYGLSECASVVAVNRPGASRSGTVGQPLPGLTVTIEDDEIVVAGPSVMDGYLNGAAAPLRWRTGDLGRLDDDGFLSVLGRRDNLIVLPNGRNIAPEWIEALLAGDPRLAAVALGLARGERLTLLLVPSRSGDGWFAKASRSDVEQLVAAALHEVPAYARPADVVIVDRVEAVMRGLLTTNGRVQRRQLAGYLDDRSNRPAAGDETAFYDRLQLATAEARNRFLEIPLVRDALATGGSRELYLAFLTQAYYHVRHTYPLLALAASRTDDERYQDALAAYMNEERGHERWILDDIRAMGGDAEAVACGTPGRACQVMVGYVYYAIEHVSPFAMLGMVHVLEGLSVLLAHQLAGVVQKALGVGSGAGFSYLRSHGSLDVEHVELFRNLVNGIEDRAVRETIIDTANIVYRLYGAIFEDIGAQYEGQRHAA